MRHWLPVLWLWALAAVAGAVDPLPEPDLSAADPLVRQTLERARADTQALLATPGRAASTQGQALGELGRLYDAHFVLEAATACYRQALRLEPGNFQWSYYLGYLLQRTGRLDEAADTYAMALEAAPDSAVTRLRLGQVELELDRLEAAESHLQQALADPSLAAPAWFELGQLAYAQNRPELAVERLQQALALSPDASRLHYTLALAYRALGDNERARSELALRGDREPEVPDPLVEELERLSSGQRMSFFLGIGAAERGEYSEAARHFREGLERDPDNLNARVSLARFLYLAGERDAAGAELQRVLAADPGQVLANFLLGLWYAERGDRDDAERHLEAALEREPLHSGSHFYLGELHAAAGDLQQAADHYALALDQAPENSAARLGWILALIDLGTDHRILLKRLEEARERHPEVEAFAYFLAALLAASPDQGVRDGDRALALAEPLYRGYRSPEHAELLAMAHAERGEFDQALSLQQRAEELAIGEGRWYLLPRLAANREQFAQGQPSRTPWSGGSLLAQLPRASLSKPFHDYPTELGY